MKKENEKKIKLAPPERQPHFETMLICEITKEKGEVKHIAFSIDKSEKDKFENLYRINKHFRGMLNNTAVEMAKRQTTDFQQHAFFMRPPTDDGHMSMSEKGMKQWKDFSEGRVGYR